MDTLTLSFVTDSEDGRNFWDVKSTGNYECDWKLGSALAAEYLSLVRKQQVTAFMTTSIVNDFPKEKTGIEAAFLSHLTMGASGLAIEGV